MIKKPRNDINKKQPQSRKKSVLTLSFRAFLSLAFVASVSYAVYSIARLTTTASYETATPDYLIRLQLVNASGKELATGRLDKMLSEFSDKEIEIIVVDKREFDSQDVEKSMVVSRESDTRAAVILAEHLGLESEDIAYKVLENNVRQVSTTLIIGQDFESLSLLGDTKETLEEI